MRFWIGKEKEGRYKGVKTLFVQSSILNDEVLNKVEDILKRYSVGQIYFGAGSVQVNECTNPNKFREVTKGILTSVECFTYMDWYENYFEHIILNVNAPLSNNVSIKIRSPNTVTVFPIETGYDTCLDELKDDLFLDTDEEIE